LVISANPWLDGEAVFRETGKGLVHRYINQLVESILKRWASIRMLSIFYAEQHHYLFITICLSTRVSSDNAGDCKYPISYEFFLFSLSIAYCIPEALLPRSSKAPHPLQIVLKALQFKGFHK